MQVPCNHSLDAASSQCTVKFQLVVHLLDNGGTDPGQLR